MTDAEKIAELRDIIRRATDQLRQLENTTQTPRHGLRLASREASARDSVRGAA